MRHAALAAALSLATPSAHAWCRTTTMPAQPDPLMCPAEGRPLAWPSGCAGFRFDPTVRPDPSAITPAQLERALDGSARAWAGLSCGGAAGASPSFALARLPDAVTPAGYDGLGRDTNTVAFRLTWGLDAFHPPDAAAVTVVTFGARSAEILDADTDLNLRGPSNPRGFRFATDGDASSADLQTVLTHELGHLQGLAHSDSREAVMWFQAGRGEQRQTPTDDDARGLCAAYPPGASVCDPAVLGAVLGGGGVGCAARPGGGAAAWWLLGLAALIARRRG